MNRKQRRGRKSSALDVTYRKKFNDSSPEKILKATCAWARSKGLLGFEKELRNNPELAKKSYNKLRTINQKACDMVAMMGIPAQLGDDFKIICQEEDVGVLIDVLEQLFAEEGLSTSPIPKLENYL